MHAKQIMKNIVTYFFLTVSSSLFAAETTIEIVALHPEDYYGQELVFDQAKCSGNVNKDESSGYYTLGVTSEGGKGFISVLVSYDFNFILNRDLADQITLDDQLNASNRYLCRITATIGTLPGRYSTSSPYQVALISKLEFYSNSGSIIKTLETTEINTSVDTSDPVEEARLNGIEEGRQQCISDPSFCGIKVESTEDITNLINEAKSNGIIFGRNQCINNPVSCGIELIDNSDIYDKKTDTLNIPSVLANGIYYKVELKGPFNILKAEPIN